MASNELKLHFNAPGFRSQEVDIAPSIDASPSKRKPMIDEEDVMLNDNIKELDLGTRARNRAFQDRLDEIWGSTAVFDKKLQKEAQDAMETILNMKDDYQRHISNFSSSLLAEVHGIFDKFDNDRLPAEALRLDAVDADLEIFFKQIVPSTIEKQSGEVSRQLRRAYETFDIEKKKEEKRESKMVKRAAKHFQKTSQRFEDEDGFSSSSFHNLENDVITHERVAARMHLMRNATAMTNVADLTDVALAEGRTRESEDIIVLDTVIDTQHLLQETVLMHFGTKSDELLVFDKLDSRMAQIDQKKADKAGSSAAPSSPQMLPTS